MKINPLTGPTDIFDNIIYSHASDMPLLNNDLIDFLKANVSSDFPNIKEVPMDDLLKHQGKLELIAELEYLVKNLEDMEDE